MFRRSAFLSTVSLALMLATAAMAEDQLTTITQMPTASAAAKAVPPSSVYGPPAPASVPASAVVTRSSRLMTPSNAPVSLTADSMTRDEAAGTVTASGHVEMEQAGRKLVADQVVYNMATGHILAKGNVILHDDNGDEHRADSIDLSDQMKVGDAAGISSTLKDGSRFWAKTGHRVANRETVLSDASYTPCIPCKDHPDSPPPWQINATKVEHDEIAHSIIYHNATFDILGVPVLYAPYFSHPDGTVERKSGFLTPSVGYKSRQGLMLTNSYYYAMDPSYDATMGITAMTQQAPLVFGEYRQRFNNASLKVNGSMTYSSRIDDLNGTNELVGDTVRGHLFAKGIWDMDSKWRAGLNAEYASDDQYLKQYDFSSKDVLENQVYLERFSGRDYAVGRFMTFQDLRIQTLRTDQPNVLPQIEANFLGEPAQMLGGRWNLHFSTLGLLRQGSSQDMQRVSAEAGWQRRFVSDLGLLTVADLTLRGDAYYVNNRTPDANYPTLPNQGGATRSFAQANVKTSYPVARPIGHAQMIVEPLVALAVSPNIDSNNPKIPNEDSQDVQLDTSNLFSPNRFPGYDRIEDKSHATYGLRTGVYGEKGSRGEVFVGQSYRFQGADNPFPSGSGLDHQYSDVVGEVIANYRSRYTFNYKFDLDSQTYAARRHEASLGLNFGKFTSGISYLYSRPLAGTSLTTTREQVSGNASYAFTNEWKLRSTATKDLGVNAGLRNATFGLDYNGQCYSVSSNLERNLTQDSSGISSTVIMFRIGFKNLGTFSTSGINLDKSNAATTAANSVTP